MKFICGLLFIVCILEAHLVIDARKEKQLIASTQDNFINLNILAIRMNIKMAEEIAVNPVEAAEHLNKAICGGNPFPENFINNTTVREQTNFSLLALKEEVDSYCKKSTPEAK